MSPDAEELRRGFLDSIGVTLPAWTALEKRLTQSFRAREGGFGFLDDQPFVERAVASDQVVGAARAVETNLVECRIHEQDHAALAAVGIGLAATAADSESGIRLTAAAVAHLRAAVSALDCMAAVCIGLLRVPVSIRRASFGQIHPLQVDRAADDTQRGLWVDFNDVIKRHESPRGWIRWTLEMRNAFLHRGRPLQLMVQRDLETPSIYLPGDVRQQLVMERLRADAHFTSQPWLPDLEHLAQAHSSASDAVLNEPASVTLRGVSEATVALVDGVGAWLNENWERVLSFCASPADAWRLEPQAASPFKGFASTYEGPNLTGMMVSPRDLERIQLGQELRTRAVASDDQ